MTPPATPPRTRQPRRRALLSLLALTLATLAPPRTHSQNATPATPLRIACMASVTSNINRDDALASIKVLGRAIAARRQLPLQVESAIYDTVSEVQAGLEKHAVDLIVMNSAAYLQLAARDADLDPVFMPGYATPRAREYLLLQPRGSTTSLADLRGKRILLLHARGAQLARPWLDHELRVRGLAPAEKFFATVQEVSKATAALLPVFFGQADACVLNRESYELNTELNPQLGARLQITTNSPSYLESVICLRRSYTGQRPELLAALSEMHQHPDGQQILTLFTITSIIPYHHEALATVRQLLPPPTPGPATP